MKIACLGWGSLIWDPKELQLKQTQHPWHPDGPILPVEFARKSRDGRLTLVIVTDGEERPVLWAEHAFNDLTEARANLCEREWHGGDPRSVVGLWQRDSLEQSLHAEKIDRWAKSQEFDAVIWTKLPPRFKGQERELSVEEAIDYLQSLSGDEKRLAEEYVRRTPRQIETRFRKVIESVLGWTYDGSLTDAKIAT